MSFRNRLTFFFVVIVIVPMVAVALVLFRLISDNESGKADAGVQAQAQAAEGLYSRASAGADAKIDVIGRDRVLDQSLAAGNIARATKRANQLIARGLAARIQIVRPAGTVLLNAGDPTAIAGAGRDVIYANRPLGRFEASTLRADRYGAEVQQISGLQVIVHAGPSVLASTLAPPPPSTLRVGTSPVQLKVDGQSYRAISFGTRPGFSGRPVTVTLLSNRASVSSNVAASRLLASGIIAGFFVIAFALALLVSRSLQSQIDGFLHAAQRLGSGDFSATVPTTGGDEFAALGEEFNKMSRQLEQRLEELRQQQARLEQTLQRIGETFASNLDREALLEIVLRTALDGVGASAGRARVRSGAGGRMMERVRVGELDGHEDMVRKVESVAVRSRAPEAVEANGVGVLAHPLLGGEEGSDVQAVISVLREDRPFSAGERELFNYLAGQAGVSIENVELHETVQRQAVTDELTGLYNHRRFQEAIATEVERSKRFDQDVGLIMLDIDDFKGVNDSYGHQQGDFVLREVARVLRESSREIDSPARYGGEELAVVLPGTNLEGAFNLGERVRQQIAALDLPLVEGEGTIRVTASLGVAAVPACGSDPRALISAADSALYEAKRSGKNKTVRAR